MTMKGLLLAATAALLGVGCGDDADGGDANGRDGGTNVGMEVAETVEAAEGGTVELAGAAVEIPADALGEDTEISIEVISPRSLPRAGDLASDVYDLGPDGTVFDEPVTLTFEFDASATPSGMRAVIAWLDADNERWVPLADSRVSGDTVTGTTDHFTPFTVLFTAAGQTGGECDDIGPTDCGGDVVGTWEFSLGCLTLPDDFLVDEETGEDPFADCEGVRLGATVDFDGTVTFGEDGSYELDLTQDSEVVISVPKECLGSMDCSALRNETSAMVVDAGERCDVLEQQMSTTDENGTWELEGDHTLFLMAEGETEPDQPTTFCVDGDTLTARSVNEQGIVQIYRATRR